MRSVILLSPLIAVGLSLATAGFEGQEPAPTAVRMHALSPGDTVYILMDGGGHSIALADEVSGGVVLVDTKRTGWAQTILEAVSFVTDLPVTTIINTHAHKDHTGSNGEFPDVTKIIAHENTKIAMGRMDAFQGSSATGLPNATYSETLSLLEGPNRVELYHFGAAHTNGDTIVVFPEKGVAHLGDLFAAKAVPFIDTNNGGSGVAYPETLAKAVAAIEGIRTVITGHSPLPPVPGVQGMLEVLTWDDLREYADFNRDFLAAVQTAFDAGKSVDQAMTTLRLPEEYANYDMERAGENVQIIYDELGTRADAGKRLDAAVARNAGRRSLLKRTEF